MTDAELFTLHWVIDKYSGIINERIRTGPEGTFENSTYDLEMIRQARKILNSTTVITLNPERIGSTLQSLLDEEPRAFRCRNCSWWQIPMDEKDGNSCYTCDYIEHGLRKREDRNG